MSIMTTLDTKSIRLALSEARLTKYDLAVSAGEKSALDLYAWNALISGSLLTPLQVCEVVIRNAVSDALEAVYLTEWPWNATFEKSLPYARRIELLQAREGASATGQVIPELTFYFWQSMFTNRFFVRLWEPFIDSIFPNIRNNMARQEKRKYIHDELEHIRKLRNRIAHHEPVFNRNLPEDYQKIVALVALRCPVSARWLSINQFFTSIYAIKP